MNKYLIVLSALSLVIIITSCEKPLENIDDYFPKVKTVSAVVLDDGSVEVKGQIISEGEAPIQNAGFCVSTNPVPTMLENQIIAGSDFKAIYSGFDIYQKYYFRTWAVNDFGYSYGDVISLDSIIATPIIAPCTPSLNYLYTGITQPTQTIYEVGLPVYDGIESWKFQAKSTNVTVNFEFGEKPKTKIYTVSTSQVQSEKIKVSFYSGFITGSLSLGSKIYVNQLNADSWEITICDAPWTYNTSTLSFTTRFISPL